MNKQFAAATPDTHGTKRKAKNKSVLGSAVLSSFLHEAESRPSKLKLSPAGYNTLSFIPLIRVWKWHVNITQLTATLP